MIYLDNNATTRIDLRVVEHFANVLSQRLGNPASQHGVGRTARSIVEDARDGMLRLIGAHTLGMASDSFLFTSGGTEANNLALFGIASQRPGTIVVSSIEHPSVLAAAQRLEQLGRTVRYLPCSNSGKILIDPLRAWVEQGEKISMVSLMLANNETGVLQPVSELVTVCQALGIAVHTDAVQAFGKIPVDFRSLGVDAMTITAHKIHGPIGIGGLALRHGLKLDPMFYGGFQQQSLRPGTESPALASAFAFTSTLCLGNRDERYERMSHCRRRLESALRERIPQAVILGEPEERLPHTLSISFPGVDRQALQLALDRVGVACGTGSACASGSSQPSHVLQAMRLDPTIIRGAIRLSLSWETTESEIDEAVAKISQSVARLHR